MSWNLVKFGIAMLLAASDATRGYQQREWWWVALGLLWAFVSGLSFAMEVMA